MTAPTEWEDGYEQGWKDARKQYVALDVDRLRLAIQAVSVRHDWATTTDTDDRTQEIAAEYARLSGVSS